MRHCCDSLISTTLLATVLLQFYLLILFISLNRSTGHAIGQAELPLLDHKTNYFRWSVELVHCTFSTRSLQLHFFPTLLNKK